MNLAAVLAAVTAAIVHLDVPLMSLPDRLSPRRGTAAQGARLPVFTRSPGPGCTGPWLLTTAGAWLCQDDARATLEPPLPGPDPALAPSGLPFRYYLVGPTGAAAYPRPSLDPTQSRQLLPGFGVTLAEERTIRGVRLGRTRRGAWLRMDALRPAPQPLFHGQEVANGRLDFAWFLSSSGPPRLVPVLAERVLSGQPQVQVGPAEWLPARALRRPSRSPRPAGVGPTERWIDVDLSAQVLIAYEGDLPRFATLVSTGIGEPGRPLSTPRGLHRIWAKLVGATMDNLEHPDAGAPYSIEDAPFVQYIARGVALHGAFWHQDFGQRRSHGCINLSPLDAQRLFSFTGPRLPPGWSAVLPTPTDRGTAVRVR